MLLFFCFGWIARSPRSICRSLLTPLAVLVPPCVPCLFLPLLCVLHTPSCIQIAAMSTRGDIIFASFKTGLKRDGSVNEPPLPSRQLTCNYVLMGLRCSLSLGPCAGRPLFSPLFHWSSSSAFPCVSAEVPHPLFTSTATLPYYPTPWSCPAFNSSGVFISCIFSLRQRLTSRMGVKSQYCATCRLAMNERMPCFQISMTSPKVLVRSEACKGSVPPLRRTNGCKESIARMVRTCA